MSSFNLDTMSPVNASPSEKVFLHRARVVVPVIQPPIDDGAVLVADGVIQDVGPYRLLRRQAFAPHVSDHWEGAVLPALINAHTHLDLSGLAGHLRPEGGMAAWIRELLAARQRLGTAEAAAARWQALASLRALGTGVVGDIDSSSTFTEENTPGLPLVRTFFEVLGLNAKRLQGALRSLSAPARRALATGREEISLAVHAPYTSSANLLGEVKAWGAARGKIVSVHAGESEEENVFLRTGRGRLRDLLEERGMEPGRWRPPGCTAVEYLDRLGFLDPLSLCVHVVQVNENEIHLLRRSGAGVCLCPRSNLFLGHGLPPVARFLEAGIPCAIGTDSLASNEDLSLFKEMAVLVDRCGIRADTVIGMATLHGARNLGLAGRYGSLEKGKRWLAIRVAGDKEEDIIGAGCRGAVEWAP
ncbi:MAG: amidohydrolase family protein [Syntrophobacteria bacterium]